MKRLICAAIAALGGIAATSFAGTAGSAGQLLVVGPVETVDLANSTATVLGQRVYTTSLSGLTVGSEAAVFGTVGGDGRIRASSIQSRGLYVPGASSIFLFGTVRKAEPSLGRVVVNGVTVDLTPVMSQGTLSPAVGTELTISGTQPVSLGLVLVTSVRGIAGTGGIA